MARHVRRRTSGSIAATVIIVSKPPAAENRNVLLDSIHYTLVVAIQRGTSQSIVVRRPIVEPQNNEPILYSPRTSRKRTKRARKIRDEM